MKCSACHPENRVERKFCRECGTRLLSVCPTCGSANLPDHKYCDECGQALVERPEGAHLREVETNGNGLQCFFSDLSGYMTMAEKLDPEDVKEIMNRVFGEVAQVVVKYPGFIERFFGDAVMVIFADIYDTRDILLCKEEDFVRAFQP